MADIPTGVAHGHVTGLFGKAVADSVDVGTTPDEILLSGTVVFKAAIEPKYIRFPELTPQLFLTIEDVTATIDSGVLRDAQGAAGVELVSSFQENGEPEYFQWEATVTLAGTSVKIPVIRFEVPAGGTTDLASWVNTARNTAVQTIVTSQDRILAQQAAAQAQGIYDSISGGIGPIIETYLAAHPPVGSGVSDWADLTGKPPKFPPTDHTHPLSEVTGWSTIGLDMATASSQANARTIIGAGTSNLTLAGGGAASTAKRSDWTPAYTEITGLSATISTLLAATTQATARTALGVSIPPFTTAQITGLDSTLATFVTETELELALDSLGATVNFADVVGLPAALDAKLDDGPFWSQVWIRPTPGAALPSNLLPDYPVLIFDLA